MSHDFYQVMVGKSDMTLHGWRQLIEWSLQHACMSEHELRSVKEIWQGMWEEFLQWVVDKYGAVERLQPTPGQ